MKRYVYTYLAFATLITGLVVAGVGVAADAGTAARAGSVFLYTCSLLFIGRMVILSRRLIRESAMSRCDRCGYELTGGFSESSVCPECGSHSLMLQSTLARTSMSRDDSSDPAE